MAPIHADKVQRPVKRCSGKMLERVGEESGELDTMLLQIANDFEEEVDSTVSGLTSLLEPMLIVFMGGMVGFIVVAMFLPLFTMARLIQ